MEEHTLQPGAEEQKKPQNTIDETSEEAQTKEEVVPIESPAKGLDKSKKTKQEVIEKEIISPQENTSEEETEAKKTEKNQEEEEETHEKEVDYTELSIEELIEAYQNLSTDERWLKNHKSLQTINTLFEEKFKVDVEQQKKTFYRGRGK